MTLWTPDGERDVNREAAEQAPPPGADELTMEDLSPEERERAEAMAQELAQARAQLLEAEVANVLANHAVGIYELAAIHLTADQPNFEEAKLGVDALAALDEGLEGRLGENEATLKEALHQVRMAYVQRHQEVGAPDGAATES